MKAQPGVQWEGVADLNNRELGAMQSIQQPAVAVRGGSAQQPHRALSLSAFAGRAFVGATVRQQ